MRILHVITSFGLGGAEEIAIELACQAAATNSVAVHSVRCTSPAESKFAEDRKRKLKAAGVVWREGRAKSNKTAMLTAPFELHRAIRDLAPDIVHSHTDIPDMCLSVVRRFRSFRMARTIHNTRLWSTHPWFGRMAERGFNDDLVIAINKPTRDAYHDLRRDFGLEPTSHLRIVPNGVASVRPEDYFSWAECRAALRIDPEKFQMAFIGRLDQQKGFDTLLSAARRVPRDLARLAQLHVIGDGAMRELAQTAHDDFVSFHGPLPNARRYLKAFDLIIMPSRFEGFGLVAAEALVANVPVLISDVAALRDVVPSGWPLKTLPDEPEMLAELIANCIRGDGPQADIPDGWTEHFRSETMSNGYLRAYADYVAAAPQTGRSGGFGVHHA